MPPVAAVFLALLPIRPRLIGAVLAALAAWSAAAQPILPAVWFYRDTFSGQTTIEELRPAATPAAGTAASAHPVVALESLTTLWFVIPADQPAPALRFAGQTYALREEGLYRFLSRPETRSTAAESGVRNLIFLRSPDSTVPLLRGLSRLIAHGNRDDRQPTRALVSQLPHCTWTILTCGPARELAMAVLREFSPRYETRRVNTVAAEGPESGFDDGHSMFELRGGAFPAWTLVDLDHGLLFRTQGENFLDATTLIAALAQGTPVRYEVLSPKEFDLAFPGSGRTDGYNFAVYQQQTMRDPAARDRWYRRVLHRQVPVP